MCRVYSSCFQDSLVSRKPPDIFLCIVRLVTHCLPSIKLNIVYRYEKIFRPLFFFSGLSFYGMVAPNDVSVSPELESLKRSNAKRQKISNLKNRKQCLGFHLQHTILRTSAKPEGVWKKILSPNLSKKDSDDIETFHVFLSVFLFTHYLALINLNVYPEEKYYDEALGGGSQPRAHGESSRVMPIV